MGQRCPLSALITQLGRVTPGAQAVVAELLGRWQADIAAGIRHMQAAGEIAGELNAARAAAALLAGIQGGVVMMLSTGDLGPLAAALDLGIEHLRCRTIPARPALGDQDGGAVEPAGLEVGEGAVGVVERVGVRGD
jgi:hypothetical protein